MSQEHGNSGGYTGENQPHPAPPQYAAPQPSSQQQPPPGWQPPQAPPGGAGGFGGLGDGPGGPGQGGPGYGGPGGSPEGPQKSNKVVWIISGIALLIIAALVTVLVLLLGDDEDEDDPIATEEPTESEAEEDQEGVDLEDEPAETDFDDDEDQLGVEDEEDALAEDDQDSEDAGEITDINQALTQAQIEELLLAESDMPGGVTGYQLNPSDEWFQYWVSLWPTEQDTVAIRSEADVSDNPDLEDFATCIELSVPLSEMDTSNSAAADFDALYSDDGASFINLGIVVPEVAPETDPIWDESADLCDVTLEDRGAEFGFFDIDGVRGIGFREPGDDYWFSVELSMDMGDNLLWVHAMDITSEDLEDIVGAQAAKLDQYN